MDSHLLIVRTDFKVVLECELSLEQGFGFLPKSQGKISPRVITTLPGANFENQWPSFIAKGTTFWPDPLHLFTPPGEFRRPYGPKNVESSDKTYELCILSSLDCA